MCSPNLLGDNNNIIDVPLVSEAVTCGSDPAPWNSVLWNPSGLTSLDGLMVGKTMVNLKCWRCSCLLVWPTKTDQTGNQYWSLECVLVEDVYTCTCEIKNNQVFFKLFVSVILWVWGVKLSVWLNVTVWLCSKKTSDSSTMRTIENTDTSESRGKQDEVYVFLVTFCT